MTSLITMWSQVHIAYDIYDFRTLAETKDILSNTNEMCDFWADDT